jgi:hypothetical protein
VALAGSADAGFAADAVVDSSERGAGVGDDLRGMIANSLFRLRAATSSFVVVSGFNCAGSFHVVSLPGAAPLSI